MKTIDLPTARRLLRTRDDVLDLGCTEREVAGLVSSQRLTRVRRDRYIATTEFDALRIEGRNLVQVVPAQLNSDPCGPVFWGPSAAVLHGLPLYQLEPRNVHTAILGARHGRTRAGVMQHNVVVPVTDIVEIDGIRCTSLDRTIVDLACTVAETTAVSAADAALRREAVSGHHHDPDQAERWHARIAARRRQQGPRHPSCETDPRLRRWSCAASRREREPTHAASDRLP